MCVSGSSSCLKSLEHVLEIHTSLEVHLRGVDQEVWSKLLTIVAYVAGLSGFPPNHTY